MYLIEPYKGIQGIYLNSSPNEIEQLLGKCDLTSNEYAPDYLTGFYNGGTTVSYKGNLACYIGILISLSPVHLGFNFLDKSYDEVMYYFRQYPGNIYVEGEVVILSDFLGISVYFEDGIKEVSIFTKSYEAELIKGLEILPLSEARV